MLPYDPLWRIAEANERDKADALEICARYFRANSLDDFVTIITDISLRLKKHPEPYDFFEWFYKSIQAQAHECVLSLLAAKLWANLNKIEIEVVDIEPSSSKVEFIDMNGITATIKVYKDVSHHTYEYPCMIIEDVFGNLQKVFIEIDALNNLYKQESDG